MQQITHNAAFLSVKLLVQTFKMTLKQKRQSSASYKFIKLCSNIQLLSE